MKYIAAVLLTIAGSTFAAPVAMTPERRVSQPVLAPAAADQHVRGVASSDQIALAIWDDGRSGVGNLYATRIDANGNVLDPSGILIPQAAGARGVIWNGNAFVIISSDLIFVAPDGTILKRKPLSTTQFMARSGSGAGVRMLFVSGTHGIILDGNGDVVTSSVELWPSDVLATFLVAGGSSSEFLVLYNWLGKLFASRIDRDGKRLSSVESGIDRDRLGRVPAIAGNANGWLAAGRGTYQMTTFPLDGNGVLRGIPTALESPQEIYDSVPPTIVAAGDSYLVTWTTNSPPSAPVFSLDTPSLTSMVRIGASGTLLAPSMQRRESYTGAGFETAATMIGSKWLILSSEKHGKATGIDPIARVLSDTLEEIVAPFSATSTPTWQTTPRAASTASNYAVVWTEYGPDPAIHVRLRRFSLNAIPIDAAPIEVTADVPEYVPPTAQIVAAGDTYVVAWPVPAGYNMRRLSASTGLWLDAAPIVFDLASDLVIGGNGEGAIAVYRRIGMVRSRVIAASGLPLVAAISRWSFRKRSTRRWRPIRRRFSPSIPIRSASSAHR